MSARAVAEMIAHLGRMAHGDGFVGGLTSVQWTALRYFASANRFSRTPSAFAEFHGTTRGTASQTTESLVARGYLLRTPSEVDGRSTRLDLTDIARAILADDPFEVLVRAASVIPPGTRQQITHVLERMRGHAARERCKRPFGSCLSCENLEGDGRRRKGQPPYECSFAGVPLAETELQQLCINFTPGRNSAMKRTYADGG